MAVNKVIYGGEVLIDLTSDTVTEDKLLSGIKAHDKAGELIEGTCTFDVDSTSATITASEMLLGKTAYARGSELTGTMANNGAVEGIISTKDGVYTIPIGYHDGSGTAKIDPVEAGKIVSGNIKEGVQILGVTGTLEPSSSIKAQAKTVVPLIAKQIITPDEGYDYLSQVEVSAIPYVETTNSAGGTTVTIAG